MMHTTDRSRPTRLHRRFEATRGQILVIFALSIFVFISLSAVVVDVSWFWSNELRMQRAADAAALAGVVHLPSDVPNAVIDAKQEAAKNGYPDGVNTNIVTAWQDPTNPRRLRVTVEARVGTFFARVIGINSFPAAAQAKADYVLPVPMGSPENYYGVFGLIRHCATATPTPAGNPCVQSGGVTTYPPPTVTHPTTVYFLPTTSPSGSTWLTPNNGWTIDGTFATRNSTTNPFQAYGNFGITMLAGTNVVEGISVEVKAKSTDNTGCQLGVALTWSAATITGANWTARQTVALTNINAISTVGSASDLWGRTWTPAELTNANFRIRVENIDPGAACTDASTTSLDYVRVRVTYQNTATNPSVFTPDTTVVAGPQGQALQARGFWGMMMTQGAETISGDAYLPKYDIIGGTVNPNYNQFDYYNYAIEMAAGSTGGSVWIYDPGFCEGVLATGTGDTWAGSVYNPVSSFYDLYDTKSTPYDLTDDTLVPLFTSGNTFKQQHGSDPTLNGANGTGIGDCDAYHLGWYQLGTSTLAGGATGHVYRLHTSTLDPNSATDQLTTNARNGWAIYTKVASGIAPKIYGIGAMETYTPLPSGTASEFFLAQIEATYAGKTMEIKLFDAGDTNQNANIQILIPTASSPGWAATNFSYTAVRGTSNGGATNCDSFAGTDVPSVVTYDSTLTPKSRYNGCWITLQIRIPSDYTGAQFNGYTGWWKIRYNMTGVGATATDITTWQVAIRGNPVHLVLP